MTTIHTFCSEAGQDCPDGANPNGVIQGTDGKLYGSTLDGGGVSSSEVGSTTSKDCAGNYYFNYLDDGKPCAWRQKAQTRAVPFL